MRTFYLTILILSTAISAFAEGDFRVYQSAIKQIERADLPVLVIITSGQRFIFHQPSGFITQTDEARKTITLSAEDGKSAILLQITTNYPGKLPDDSVLKTLASNRFPGAQVIQTGAAHGLAGARFVELIRVVGENVSVKIRSFFVPFPNGMLEVVYSANSLQFDDGKRFLQQVLNSIKIDAAPKEQPHPDK